MGNCVGNGSRRDAVTVNIDKRLKEEKNTDDTIRKVLLLGTGESGKSTVLKQMKIVYDHGFSDIEKDSFVPAVRRNTFDCMRALVQELSDVKTQFTNEEENACSVLTGIQTGQDFFNTQVLAAIELLWKHEAIRGLCATRPSDSKLHLMDSAPYLFDSASRFWAADYKPTDQDILRARLRTTGIVEKQIAVDGLIFKFVDMGGQKTERRKWINCFDDVTAVMFVAAISEYNQMMYEDNTTNRLVDCLNVFEQVLYHQTPVFPKHSAKNKQQPSPLSHTHRAASMIQNNNNGNSNSSSGGLLPASTNNSSGATTPTSATAASAAAMTGAVASTPPTSSTSSSTPPTVAPTAITITTSNNSSSTNNNTTPTTASSSSSNQSNSSSSNSTPSSSNFTNATPAQGPSPQEMKNSDNLTFRQTFGDSAIILFLNKVDLFRHKVPRVPFSSFFPEYKGANDSAEQVAEFIKMLFAARCSRRKRQVFVHFTCATDTANFRVVFNACKESILQVNLNNAGLVL